MKTALTLIAVLGIGLSSSAQLSQTRVIERGAHYKVFEATILITNEITGTILSNVSHYTELGNGLSYLDATGHWQESNPQFSITNGSAVATQTLSKVILAPNLNSSGSVDILAPGEGRLESRSRPKPDGCYRR